MYRNPQDNTSVYLKKCMLRSSLKNPYTSPHLGVPEKVFFNDLLVQTHTILDLIPHDKLFGNDPLLQKLTILHLSVPDKLFETGSIVYTCTSLQNNVTGNGGLFSECGICIDVNTFFVQQFKDD